MTVAVGFIPRLKGTTPRVAERRMNIWPGISIVAPRRTTDERPCPWLESHGYLHQVASRLQWAGRSAQVRKDLKPQMNYHERRQKFPSSSTVVYLRLSALVAASPRRVSMVIFTTEAQRPQRILCVYSSGARISFRVFPCFAVTFPAQ
jgi:hypothetical protein